MKIVVDSAIPYIKGVLEPYADVVYLKGQEIGPSDVADADALLVRTRTRCDSRLLGGSSVRFVATATAGIDHVDVKWCRSAGIRTVNAPGCNAWAVVQYLYTSLFYVAENAGIRLSGKRIGIIGAGNVGGRAASLARAFGLEPIICDPPRAAVEGKAGFTELGDLLESSDIVTLHVPLDESTYHLADANFFRRMPKKAIFVNASRGETSDESSLISSRDGLSALILDVWPNEPAVSESLMRCADIATPHIAGYSLAGKLNATAAAVRAFAEFYGIEELRHFDPASAFDVHDVYRNLDLKGTQSEIAAHLLDIYDIEKDSGALKASPDRFEQLRTQYHYRTEFYVGR